MGTYFGFSGYSGSKNYIQFDINSVETRNFDATKSGEDLASDISSDVDAWTKTLEEEKRYLSKASQMEAVERLTKLLKDHVETYNEAGASIQAEVGQMEKRLEALGQDFGKLFAEAEAFDFKTNTFNPDAVREHLNSVKSILSKAKHTHDSTLGKLNDVAKDLREKGVSRHGEERKHKVAAAGDQAKIVQDSMDTGANQTSFMLLIIVLIVGFLICLFLKRMRYYEKKHYI